MTNTLVLDRYAADMADGKWGSDAYAKGRTAVAELAAAAGDDGYYCRAALVDLVFDALQRTSTKDGDIGELTADLTWTRGVVANVINDMVQALYGANPEDVAA